VAYRHSPNPETKQELKTKFCQLFGTETGYKQLDERKKLTAAKESELLLVLEYPNLPLHNNPAELAARTMVQRRKISYATQTSEGTKAWDIFMRRQYPKQKWTVDSQVPDEILARFRDITNSERLQPQQSPIADVPEATITKADEAIQQASYKLTAADKETILLLSLSGCSE
jgi:hypothetical protein